MYIVYILRSKIAQKSYVGSTDNLSRRLKEHNTGKHVYTRRYLPWEVLHTENYKTLKEARQREKYLKTTSGRRFLKKIFDKNNKGSSNGPPR